MAPVTAFAEETPWSPHIPGIPLHDRPVTYDAFHRAGFRTLGQWLLFHRPAGPGDAPPPEPLDPGAAGGVVATVDLLAPGASRRCRILQDRGFEEVDLLRSLVLA
ncbi:hypothetical protein [Kitasatospora sp. NPDC048538]|uniref:hypothetical protein n=1 Tax=unclassified Kitasatospora TaxID=2633591 RepID=UPI0033CC9FA4